MLEKIETKLTPANAGKMQDIQRSRDGRFEKGQSGNPRGKTKGTLNRATLIAKALTDRDSVAIIKQAVNIAKNGRDWSLLKFFVGRMLPRQRDAQVTFDLPSIQDIAGLIQAQQSILQAVAQGELTPAEGHAVMGMTESVLKNLKARDGGDAVCGE